MKPPRLTELPETRAVPAFPTVLEPGVIYLCAVYGMAAWLCPCQCGNQVVINVDGGENSWSLTVDDGDRVTFAPSVAVRMCGAHYFIRKSQVEWC